MASVIDLSMDDDAQGIKLAHVEAALCVTNALVFKRHVS